MRGYGGLLQIGETKHYILTFSLRFTYGLSDMLRPNNNAQIMVSASYACTSQRDNRRASGDHRVWRPCKIIRRGLSVLVSHHVDCFRMGLR